MTQLIFIGISSFDIFIYLRHYITLLNYFIQAFFPTQIFKQDIKKLKNNNKKKHITVTSE